MDRSHRVFVSPSYEDLRAEQEIMEALIGLVQL